MHRLLVMAFALSILATGCAFAASQGPLSTSPPLEPMITLPPIAASGPSTTTTAPGDSEAPAIETSLRNGDAIDWYRGKIIVSTEPDAIVTVDGEPMELDLFGSTSVIVVNAPGENAIEVTATDAAGNTTLEVITYEFTPPDGWITAIGDSIMLGTRDEIEKRLGADIVDATVSRQFNEAPGLVGDLVGRPAPPQAIIIGLGTNGPVQARDFDKVMDTVDPATLVAFINVRMPRDWEATSNNALAAGVERYDNAILIDWFSVSDDRNELFAGDGFHPSQAGRVIMADLIAEAIIPGWDAEDSP